MKHPKYTLILLAPLILAVFVLAAPRQDKSDEHTLPLDEGKLRARWRNLDDRQTGEIVLHNLHGLVRAIHKYHDVYGSLPPAVVPNTHLPPEKRLSGFVLLLPHLDAPTYLNYGEEGGTVFDRELTNFARSLYESIDLEKAWDDPVNLKAARTVVPAFVAPGSGSFRDKNGYAVSHFAFVRGANGKDDGAFNETVGIAILEGDKIISDGTVSTLALGQINDELGPWIASGFSTARHVYHPSDVFMDPTFGSPYDGGCYFVNCDSYAYFLDIDKTPARSLHALATRAGGEIVTGIYRFRTAAEWKAVRTFGN